MGGMALLKALLLAEDLPSSSDLEGKAAADMTDLKDDKSSDAMTITRHNAPFSKVSFKFPAGIPKKPNSADDQKGKSFEFATFIHDQKLTFNFEMIPGKNDTDPFFYLEVKTKPKQPLTVMYALSTPDTKSQVLSRSTVYGWNEKLFIKRITPDRWNSRRKESEGDFYLPILPAHTGKVIRFQVDICLFEEHPSHAPPLPKRVKQPIWQMEPNGAFLTDFELRAKDESIVIKCMRSYVANGCPLAFDSLRPVQKVIGVGADNKATDLKSATTVAGYMVLPDLVSLEELNLFLQAVYMGPTYLFEQENMGHSWSVLEHLLSAFHYCRMTECRAAVESHLAMLVKTNPDKYFECAVILFIGPLKNELEKLKVAIYDHIQKTPAAAITITEHLAKAFTQQNKETGVPSSKKALPIDPAE